MFKKTGKGELNGTPVMVKDVKEAKKEEKAKKDKKSK